ncbi:MAG: hypothetical protein HY565_02950 [Candidatus Kerfeldbacteria bacterium]|nr:hypothetical protein [Candidatus Kerfeldbacteria bacterium]
MSILILVHPVPDLTSLHTEILCRMNCRPYVLCLPEYPDDFIPTRQQTLQIGAAIAEHVMEGLYPAGLDIVVRAEEASDIIGTHLDICQMLPDVQADDYDYFTFRYHLRWEEDDEGFVVVDAAQGDENPAANVVVHCQVLRPSQLPSFIAVQEVNVDGTEAFKAVDTRVVG